MRSTKSSANARDRTEKKFANENEKLVGEGKSAQGEDALR